VSDLLVRVLFINSHVTPFSSQCEELAKEGAKIAATPAAVVAQSDCTYAVLADPAAALEVRGIARCAMRIGYA
jgi:3-hydroxyisobutyrate dehydrogenase-like beta-hydroxyacid dehydrogenase